MNGNSNIWNIRTRILNSQWNTNFSGSFQPDQEKACSICPFQGFNISQKSKSSPLSNFFTSLNLAPNWYPIIFTGQIYFHWYKILGLLHKRALFDLQFVHNLFWLKLKWNARWKLFYCIIYRSSIWSSRTLTFGAKLISDNFYGFVPEWFLFLYFKYWYFRSLKRFWDCDFNFVNVLELHQSM
jgi:hypothetical protein